MSLRWSPSRPSGRGATFDDVSERYLESLFGDEEARDSARRDLQTHILPHFGATRLDQVTETDLLSWLSSKERSGGEASHNDPERLRKLLGRMWSLAVDLNLADAEANPLAGSLRFDRRGQGDALLSTDEVQQLLLSARGSHNRQLKYIVALLMLSGARTGEILNMSWDHVDLSVASWKVHVPGIDAPRELKLTPPAVTLLQRLPRFQACRYVVPNPATKRPYRSLSQSWDVVKAKALLPHLELDDLRYCDLGVAPWTDRLLDVIFADDDQPDAAPG
jgi:integrase